MLFLEDKGWDTSWRGSKQMEQERFDRYRESTLRNVLYIFRQRLQEPGMIFESQGSDVIENLPVDHGRYHRFREPRDPCSFSPVDEASGAPDL